MGTGLTVPAIAPDTLAFSTPVAHAQDVGPVNQAQLDQAAGMLGPTVPAPTSQAGAARIASIPSGTPGLGSCVVDMWAHTKSQPIGTNGMSADVDRNLQVNPQSMGELFDNQPLADGSLISRWDDEGNLIPVTGADAGFTTFVLDGWTSGSRQNTIQNSRLRVSTEHGLDNVRIVWRIDSKATMNMGPIDLVSASWDNWWASGYSSAASSLTTGYETAADGTVYAVISGSMPPKTRIRAQLTGRLNPEAWTANPTIYATAGMSSSSTQINCAPPAEESVNTPEYPPITVGQGQEVPGILPRETVDDVFPDGTTFAGGDNWQPWADIDPNTGAVTVRPAFDTAVQDYPMEVIVTYPDGSSEVVTVTVTVTPAQATEIDPSPVVDSVVQGTTKDIAPPAEIPEGATYELIDARPWATVNPDTGVITATPEATEPPGDYQMTLVVTYPDGSVDLVPVTVTVQESDVNSVDPHWPSEVVDWDTPTVVGTPTSTTGDIPEGTTYGEVTDAPAGISVQVDPSTGELTVTADGSTPTGPASFTVPVTYPDGTTENVLVTVVVNNPNTPHYDAVEVRQGAAGEVGPHDVDVNDVENFALAPGAPTWVSIDPATGVVTVTAGADAPLGPLTVDVVVTYESGDEQTVPVTIIVTPSDANLNDPADREVSITQGATKIVPGPANADGSAIRNVASVDFTDAAPDWAEFNADGSVTLTAPADAPVGRTAFPGLITYQDGSTAEVTLFVTVQESTASAIDINPLAVTVRQGEVKTTQAPRDADGNLLPQGTTYAIASGPAWVGANADGSGILTPGVDVAPGDYPVELRVTYRDGSWEIVPVTVTVVELNSTTYDPAYGDPVVVRQNQRGTVEAPTSDPAVPEGTTFSPEASTPGWAQVNPDGSIALSPGATVAPGNYQVPVTVTYPDRTTETITAIVVVEPTEAVENNPQYADTTVRQGGTATVAAPTDAPDSATFAAGADVPSWATVNADGTITLQPEVAVPVGDYTIPVVVTYADDSAETINARVSVTEADTSVNNPVYVSLDAIQGETTTSPAPLNRDGTALPTGTTFEFEGDTPDWVELNSDGSVAATPGDDVAPGPVTVQVRVTYPDGTSDLVPVVIDVTNPNAPYYLVTEGVAQTTVTSQPPVNPDEAPLPEGSIFRLDADAPAGASIDPVTGVITWPIPAGQPVGPVMVPVTVTYPDGTTAQLSATIVVEEADAVLVNPVYQETSVNHGSTATVPAPLNSQGVPLPEGTSFADAAGIPEWAQVNPDGTITVSPGDGVAPGTYTIPVTVTYIDGTSEVVNATVVVRGTDSEQNRSRWDPIEVAAGSTGEVATPVNPDRRPLPEGTTFAPGEGFPEWAELHPDGSLTVNPPAGTPVGAVNIPVVVTYPDGSSQDRVVTVTIVEADVPIFPTTMVVQGQSFTSQPPTLNGAPLQGDLSVVPVGDLPAGMSIDPVTGIVTWDVPEDQTLGAFNVPVQVTIDGETFDATVPFVVRAADVTVFNPSYRDTTVSQGETAVVAPPEALTGPPLPSGTVYEPGENFPAPDAPGTWVWLTPDGSILATPGDDVAPGVYEFEVEVSYTDGTGETITSVIEVTIRVTAEYDDVTVVSGGPRVTVP
ncbi:Rib/alpha-like domain-containing protein, partial [Corynebacterium sp.]|uniref:Rib/alpha-like domain-containing protein n=1 Tax=Corynebacterium sp. TaxID=1720 RepID=UPI0026E0814F